MEEEMDPVFIQISRLIVHGETVNALIAAVQSNRSDLVHYVVDHSRPTLDELVTGLCIAIDYNNENMILVLIKCGADINWRPMKYWFPLKYATMTNPHMVRCLLANGADVNISDNGTALELAAFRNDTGTMEVLLIDQVYASPEPLSKALWNIVYYDNANIVNLLADKGANINYRHPEAKPSSIFMSAVQYNRTGVILALLNHGADPNERDGDFLPLTYAMTNNNIEMVKLLLEHGANPNLQDIDPVPLIYAVSNNNAKLVELLLDHGADINMVNQNDHNALEIASYHNRPDLVGLLLDKSAHISPEIPGDVLYHAILSQDVVLIRLLLEHKVDVNYVARYDDSKSTPIMIAITRNFVNVIRVLWEFGADLTKRDNRGRLPLDIAQEMRQGEIINLLQTPRPARSA